MPQPDYSGSCMIALYPPPEVARTIAVPDGLDPDGMHVTIAYTGDAADIDPEALNAAAKALAARPPFTAAISGHARFTGGTQDCIVALVDAPELETLRSSAREALAAQGITIPSEHGFTPHMTIRYLGEDEADPVGRLPAFPVTFGAISVMHARTRTDYPFTDDIPRFAAEAYIAGYALTGAPRTGRTRAGCLAAMSVACEHRDDPRILETALDLGHLEGTRAGIAARREKLLARHLAAVAAAWDACLKDLNTRTMVRRFRRGIYLTELADPAKQWWQDTAATTALGWLYGIYRTDGYEDLLAAIEDAITAGMAEGEADALADAAARQGITGFRIGAAFTAAYERLGKTGTAATLATATLTKILDGAAADTGRKLAQMAGDGDGEDAMTPAVQALLAGGNARSPRTWTDWALWAGIGTGILGLFDRVTGGIATLATLDVTWETEADARVCPACEANGEASPYPLGSVPAFPAHPGDRCDLTTRYRFPASLFAAFLN